MTTSVLPPALAVLLLAAVPASGADLLRDGGFSRGEDGFWSSGGVTLSRSGGRLCADVPAGGEPWERMIGVGDLSLVPGAQYRLTMRLSGDGGRLVPVLVQRAMEPWSEQARIEPLPGASPTDVMLDMTAVESAPAQIVFQLGGADRPSRFCLEQISFLSLSSGTPSAVAGNGPADGSIFVNQAGYILDGPKRATIVTAQASPLAFALIDGTGRTVGRGAAVPMGFDPTVGAETQVADFSGITVGGKGFRLKAGTAESAGFSIGDDPYGRLRIDALSWFYPQRSGIEIRGDIAGEDYARPAGHVGMAPNRGDTDVGCLTGVVADALYGGWRCAYRLDVSGGWYDAGDHGKYAVTGAISAAQLLGTFERGMTFGGRGSPVFSDSLSRIPENGNGVPDILDEARYELEFLLRMMVPDGAPLAGMVHHKVHDTRWNGVPMLPHLDPEARALHRPSTAATLDVAAAAAQGARLFAAYDPAFAKVLLSAAVKAWGAAERHPALFAPFSDGQQGGGDYQDDDVSDETYFAAAELFITTGDGAYLKALKASPHWGGAVFSPAAAFDWRSVAGLARLDLALYAKNLDADDRRMVRGSVTAAAKQFLALQQREPFGQIYRPEGQGYNWGSNQMILQNMIVMAAGYDLSGDRALLAGIRESMDYLLGRNAMNLSYVTGYGAAFAKNQHSRWYAHQVDASLPNPPPGTLAGGPNSTLVDEVSRKKLQGCQPQMCYVDDIMAWGVNEMAINWNAPLVYMASFLADAR